MKVRASKARGLERLAKTMDPGEARSVVTAGARRIRRLEAESRRFRRLLKMFRVAVREGKGGGR